ncbi:MAG: hypothetical protein J6P16_06670 [Eubacterium sp.]|nr:hypothetical protein [Eubacterium sp.]
MGNKKNNDIRSGSEYEHRVYENALMALDRARSKRRSYMKYGPLVIIGSAVLFLSLMFVTELKVEFLILWIATILYSIGLMIRAEYSYYRMSELLMIPAEDEESEILNKVRADLNNLRSYVEKQNHTKAETVTGDGSSDPDSNQTDGSAPSDKDDKAGGTDK